MFLEDAVTSGLTGLKVGGVDRGGTAIWARASSFLQTHTDTFSHSTEGGKAGGHMTNTVTVAEMKGSVVSGADRRPADLQISPGDLQGRQTPSKQPQFDES